MSHVSLRGTPRRRKNRLGSPADADVYVDLQSPLMSLVPGPDLEGSRIVASSTPVRISVPLTEAPRRPTPGMVDSFGGQKNEIEVKTDTRAGGDSRRRTRAGSRAGRRNRRGQGLRQSVHADDGRSPTGQPSVGCTGDDRADNRFGRSADQLGHREDHRRIDVGLLADLVLPAGSGRTRRAAGQRPRC